MMYIYTFRQILIGAVDGGVPSLTGTLTVEVRISDINDNFPVFKKSVYTTTIPEDFGRDQPVQTVSFTDYIGLKIKYVFLFRQANLKFILRLRY